MRVELYGDPGAVPESHRAFVRDGVRAWIANGGPPEPCLACAGAFGRSFMQGGAGLFLPDGSRSGAPPAKKRAGSQSSKKKGGKKVRDWVEDKVEKVRDKVEDVKDRVEEVVSGSDASQSQKGVRSWWEDWDLREQVSDWLYSRTHNEYTFYNLGSSPRLGCPSCPDPAGEVLSLPAFSAVDSATRACFEAQLSVTDFPDTCCCPPLLNEQSTCSPPTSLAAELGAYRVPESGFEAYAGAACSKGLTLTSVVFVPGKGFRGKSYTFETCSHPTDAVRRLFGAAVHVLLENLDLAIWALCLVESWSPEIKGLALRERVQELLTPDDDGMLPFHVTWVDLSASEPSAMAWAFNNDGYVAPDRSLGVIIPAAHGELQRRAERLERRGVGAACAAVQAATELLHELVHAVGDEFDNGTDVSQADYRSRGLPVHNEPGSRHDGVEDGVVGECWDEARMVASIFVWSMARRFPCLVRSGECGRIGQDRWFGYSTSSYCQLSTRLGTSC